MLIPVEEVYYRQYLEADDILKALMMGGVQEWDGYQEAISNYIDFYNSYCLDELEPPITKITDIAKRDVYARIKELSS